MSIFCISRRPGLMPSSNCRISRTNWKATTHLLNYSESLLQTETTRRSGLERILKLDLVFASRRLAEADRSEVRTIELDALILSLVTTLRMRKALPRTSREER